MFFGKTKKQFFNLFIALCIGGAIFVFHSQNVLAATGINKKINFQGKVTNTDGTNVSNNSYNFLFCIYTTPTPATPCTAGANNDAVWRESKSLTVADGIFQTNLGDTTTLPGSVDFNTDNIYLGINFNSNGQMDPLVQFTSAPYAFNADNLDGKDWTAPGTIGSATPNTASFTTLNSSGITQLSTTAGSTLSLGNSTGTVSLISGGVSNWNNTAGNLTLSTVTSGTLALSSAAALNLSGTSLSMDTSATDDAITIEQGTYDSILSFTQSVVANQTYTFSTGGIVATTSNKLSDFAATTSAELSGVLSDENTAGGYFTNPMTTAGDIIYAGASGVPIRLAGSSTNDWVLKYSTSTNAPYWGTAGSGGMPSGTEGQMLYNNAGAWTAFSGMIWDDINNRLGIGAAIPSAFLHIVGTTEQLRLGYDADSYTTFTTASDSKMTLETAEGTQSMIKIGKGSAQNAGVSFDGNTNDYYMGMNDSADKLMVGLGLAVGTTPYITVEAAGDVGMGTTDPTAQLHTTGTVRFQNFGAGTLSTDSSGNLTVSSDEQLKNIVSSFDSSLENLINISPIIYRWNDLSGMETKDEYAGFSAQNVQENIPEAVSVDARGYLTLSDRPILATAVNGIKELFNLVKNQQVVVDSISLDAVQSKFDFGNLQSAVIDLQNAGLTLEDRVVFLENTTGQQTEKLAQIEEWINSQNPTNVESNLNIASLDAQSLDFENGNLIEIQNQVLENENKIEYLNTTLGFLQKNISALTEQIAAHSEIGSESAAETGISAENFIAGLTLDHPTDFISQINFEKAVEFLSSVSFAENVTFEKGIDVAGEIIVDQDHAGFILVPEGSKVVKIKFTNEYSETPVITASLSLQGVENPELRTAIEDYLLINDVRYLITNVTSSGFELKVGNGYDVDLPFSWQAVSVKDPKIAGEKNVQNDPVEEIAIEKIETATAFENTTAIETNDQTNESVSEILPENLATTQTTTPNMTQDLTTD